MDAALAGDSQGGAHLGIANISIRLHLIYGGRATMAVDTAAPGQTRIILEIPPEDVEGGVTR